MCVGTFKVFCFLSLTREVVGCLKDKSSGVHFLTFLCPTRSISLLMMVRKTKVNGYSKIFVFFTVTVYLIFFSAKTSVSEHLVRWLDHIQQFTQNTVF
jgi:hypothetical protein